MTESLGIVQLDDIVASAEYTTGQETGLRGALNAIGEVPLETLRSKLLAWASLGAPANHIIHSIQLPAMPVMCSDGQERSSVDDYILFVSGKTIYDHVAALRPRLVGFTVTFVRTEQNCLNVMVSKASDSA